jgi:prefoldin subunit 5
MDYEFRDKRLFLKRTAAEKQPITSQLTKIEGQVRAIRQMIESPSSSLSALANGRSARRLMRMTRQS